MYWAIVHYVHARTAIFTQKCLNATQLFKNGILLSSVFREPQSWPIDVELFFCEGWAGWIEGASWQQEMASSRAGIFVARPPSVPSFWTVATWINHLNTASSVQSSKLLKRGKLEDYQMSVTIEVELNAEMSACTGGLQVPAPAPAGTGPPKWEGSSSRPGWLSGFYRPVRWALPKIQCACPCENALIWGNILSKIYQNGMWNCYFTQRKLLQPNQSSVKHNLCLCTQ